MEDPLSSAKDHLNKLDTLHFIGIVYFKMYNAYFECMLVIAEQQDIM